MRTVPRAGAAVKAAAIWELWQEVHRAGGQAALVCQQQLLQALVEQWVAGWLGRRKREAGSGESQLCCVRCGSDDGIRYAGSYRRSLLLSAGRISLQMPRLRCRCGAWLGYVIPWLGRRRRLGLDVVAEALELVGRRVSLRDAAAHLGRRAGSSISHQTVARVVLGLPGERPAAVVPRSMSLDGVWVRARGRPRVLLVAQDEERGTILDWQESATESGAGYRRLLGRLWRRGACEATGLEQVMGDGAGSLWEVVGETWPWARRVSCWWHQLVADRQAGRALSPRPEALGRASTVRQERWNREFRRHYRQLEAFRSRASIDPRMQLIAERTLSRRSGTDWVARITTSWLQPTKTKCSPLPCS